MRKFFSPALFLIVFLAACSPVGEIVSDDTVTLRSSMGEEIVVKVEVSDSASERSRGLMDRTSLAEDTGMLFIFDSEQMQTFWMKNTLIPLEILFFNKEGTLVSWSAMPPCIADPCPHYLSGAPALYALEVSPGFIARHQITTNTWKLLTQ